MSIIEIEELSKKYLIDHEKQNIHGSLKETLTNGTKRFLNRFIPKRSRLEVEQKHTVEEFWALKNLSLTIAEGDRVALLGRNGAGKSTLLKLISRILKQRRPY